MVLVDNDDHYYTQSDLKCMNMLRHPVWIFDIDNKSMFWANHSSLFVWNATTLDELLQRDFASDMSDSTVSWLNDFKTNRLMRNEHTTEKWTFFPKGESQTLDVTCSAVRIDDGRIAMLVEAEVLDHQRAIGDITARSIEILKHLPVAVTQFSMDGKLIYQNPKASKLFGTPTDDVNKEEKDDDDNQNALLSRFVDVELGRTALLKVQNDEIFSAETQQYTISEDDSQSMDGSRWFNVGLRRARDPVTSDFVILYIARDISDIVKARKDTVKAAMKSEFLDVMAHEIRTPLHQIVGFVDLLEDSTLDNEQLNAVQQIQSSSTLLIAIINDLLDCSKLENGQLQIEKLTFSLDGLVHGCMSSVKLQAQSKGIDLACNIDAACSQYIVSDPNRLRQILHNLLSNAIKFTSNGSITVTIQPKTKPETSDTSDAHQNDTCDENDENDDPFDSLEQWLRFEVQDTGIGMDANEQKIVFERYRQANASVARNFGGTGLGLPICKGLVELLGGTIGLQSEVGEGTKVYFDIPILRAQKDHSLPSSRRSSASGDSSGMNSLQGEPMTLNILVVEDNKVNQKVVKAMLQRMGHTVTLAEHGEIALTEIKQQKFHVVLMDIQMPVMDGVECTKYIRNVLHYSKEQLPIIGLTAGYQHSDRDYYEKDVGMNGCLGKPLPMEKLRQSISKYQIHNTHLCVN